jgi:hypothetical protein
MRLINVGKRCVCCLQSFDDDFVMFSQQLSDMEALPEAIHEGIIKINAEVLKQTFLPSPKECLAQIRRILPELAAERYGVFISEVHSASTALNAPVSVVEDFVAQLEALDDAKAKDAKFGAQLVEIQSLYEVIDNHKIQVAEMDYAAYQVRAPFSPKPLP